MKFSHFFGYYPIRWHDKESKNRILIMSISILLFAIVRFVLVAVAIIGFFVTAIGIPGGIVLLIVHKNKEDKKLILWLIFGGPLLLFITFVLWALIALISTFFGISIAGV